MAYERVNWENLPSTKTPVNEDNLNKMDKGIAENNLLWDLLFDSANFFSTSKNYAVGDYTIYKHLLYKCTTAHSAGAWNNAHFTQRSVFVD